MNILIVDDEINILTLLKTILEKEGFNVFTAKNGSDAYNIYLDNHIDMVICDEMMPLVSGNELIKSIREDNNHIPIIMITAKYSTSDKKLSFKLGVDDYMVKPIDTEELIMRVNALFRRAKINTDKKIKISNVIINSNDLSIKDESKNLSIKLSKLEFDILFKLLSYHEKSFTKWQLYNEFWGIDSNTDEKIVKTLIFKIRKQIEIFPEIGIKTIMGVGYQGVRNEK